MSSTIEEVIGLALDHKWVPVAALIIGAIIRVLKSARPIGIVPPAWRPWLALALGAVAGVLQAVLAGSSWTKAVTDGLVAAMTAIAGHDLVIESLRGGRELFASRPGLKVVEGGPKGREL
ncbi:hypothetical protein LZC95_08110 [Pendulispora brunnea]|uniref:Holin n=1 Tax=Pendulispora brunnea TaxID=2905690 RepID=A0ABZ2KFF9_9BACT